MKLKDNKGLLSLEAAIVLPMFMMVMLFLYSMMLTILARDQVMDALIDLAQKVSMREYSYSVLGSSSTWSLKMDYEDVLDSEIATDILDAGDRFLHNILAPGTGEDVEYDSYYTKKDFTDRTNILNGEFLEDLRIAEGLGNSVLSWTAYENADSDEVTFKVEGEIKPIFDFWGFGVTQYEMKVNTRMMKKKSA